MHTSRPSLTENLSVYTSTGDHPAALVVYQKAGFVAYDQETITIRDPGADMPSIRRDLHGY